MKEYWVIHRISGKAVESGLGKERLGNSKSHSLYHSRVVRIPRPSLPTSGCHGHLALESIASLIKRADPM